MAGRHVERHPERVWLLLVLILTEIEERRVVPSRGVADGEWPGRGPQGWEIDPIFLEPLA